MGRSLNTPPAFSLQKCLSFRSPGFFVDEIGLSGARLPGNASLSFPPPGASAFSPPFGNDTVAAERDHVMLINAGKLSVEERGKRESREKEIRDLTGPRRRYKVNFNYTR